MIGERELTNLKHNIKADRIIFFDGVCGLCNKSVNILLKIDEKGVFKFAPLQGITSKNLLSQYEYSKLNTLVYYSDGRTRYKSDAILHISKDLNGLWKLGYVFIIIPKFIRDSIYNWIAKNRYSWFGIVDECRLLSQQEEDRFLD